MSKVIALLGQPNSGKSTVFNALTGSHQHVGNWPGKTVEKSEGSYTWKGERFNITDLPGSYSLFGNSDEEKITVDYIRGNNADLVLVLVDASQLERSMFMLAEFAALKAPAVLLLNMMDVAGAQGKKIDAKLLEERLGIPVLPFTAADGKSYDRLREVLSENLKNPKYLSSAPDLALAEDGKNVSGAKNVLNQSSVKFSWIDAQLKNVISSGERGYKSSKMDRLFLSRGKGKLLTIGVILLAFLAAMIVMIPFMGIGSAIPSYLGKPIRSGLKSLNVHPWLVSIFGLLVPNVLYFCISMAAFVLGVNIVFGYLEEIGFMARAAYQFDGLLLKLGLQGKAVCPMLMGCGCTIGGTCGTRVMDNWGQRLLAMAVVWAVPCASIWSIIPVISGMFFPVWGTMLVCLCIIAYVVLMMIVVSKVFSGRLAPKEKRTGMIMELPPYHKPHWKHIIKEALLKALDIFKRALSTVTLVSLLFWAFSFSKSGDIADSLIYKVGTFIEPVTKFFGMGWRTFMAFLSSAFAKEAVLGTLNAIFMGGDSLVNATFNSKTVATDASALGQSMSDVVSQAEALAFMFAVTFNIPCVMALSTTYRESHSIKFTLKLAAFYFGLALLLSCIVYHVAALFL